VDKLKGFAIQKNVISMEKPPRQTFVVVAFFIFKKGTPQYKMKKQLLFASILIHFTCRIATAQVVANARVMCQLPPQLGESSGIIATSPNAIWSNNDSGNPNELYLIDSSGVLKRKILVQNAFNADWEEMTTDAQGNFYVGDFGNNSNSRGDLTIYKLPNLNTLQRDTVDATQIKFSYPDQTAFPPAVSAYLFDCEAMLVFADSIFLITKDYHAKPYPGVARIYRIPNAVGTHVATFVAQVSTDNSDKQFGAITGIAMSPNQKTVVLIAHQRLYLAENFAGRAFWSVKWRVATINSFGNKEAICFRDSCNLYLSDDNGGTPSGFLYTINLCQLKTLFTPTIDINNTAEGPLSINVFPNPSEAEETVELTFSRTLTSATVDIFDPAGRLTYSIKKSNITAFQLLPSVFNGQKGLFLIRLRDNKTNEIHYQKIIRQ
jgi:hypothetical protein